MICIRQGLTEWRRSDFVATVPAKINATNIPAGPADGSRLTSTSSDSKLRLWDAKSGAHIATLHCFASRVCSITFSANGLLLAVHLDGGASGNLMRLDHSRFLRDLLRFSHSAQSVCLIEHKEPNLHGLVYMSVEDDTPSYFWFPPGIIPTPLDLHPTKPLLAVGCEGGQVLLLDIPLLFLP